MNDTSLYYAEQGAGEPLILLHGGIAGSEIWDPVVGPALAQGRRVVTVDLQGHGRSPDADRAYRPELMADDVAALIGQLGLEPADVMGYSLGGVVALRLAIQHPDRVRRLVLVSIAFRRDGSYPEVVAAFDQFSPAMAEPMKQSPAYAHYAQVAPRPEDWETHVAKTAELLHQDYDWTADVRNLTMPTMLVYADADSVRPDHIVEFYGLLGGGLSDPGWDGTHPAAHLAVVPGTTHYDLYLSPLLPAVVAPFLDA